MAIIDKHPSDSSRGGPLGRDPLFPSSGRDRDDAALVDKMLEAANFLRTIKSQSEDFENRIGQKLKELDEKIKALETSSEAYKTESEEQREKFAEKAQQSLDKLSDKLDEIKVKNVETLAVFVGLFTFVSVDFQLLRRIPDWNAAAGLIWISAGILMGFILVLDFVLTGTYRRVTLIKDLGPMIWPQLLKLFAAAAIAGLCWWNGMSYFEKYAQSASSLKQREMDEATDSPIQNMQNIFNAQAITPVTTSTR